MHRLFRECPEKTLTRGGGGSGGGIGAGSEQLPGRVWVGSA